jgi:hypothetical protein
MPRPHASCCSPVVHGNWSVMTRSLFIVCMPLQQPMQPEIPIAATSPAGSAYEVYTPHITQHSALNSAIVMTSFFCALYFLNLSPLLLLLHRLAAMVDVPSGLLTFDFASFPYNLPATSALPALSTSYGLGPEHPACLCHLSLTHSPPCQPSLHIPQCPRPTFSIPSFGYDLYQFSSSSSILISRC